MIEITYDHKGEECKAYFRTTKEQALKKFSRLGYNMEVKDHHNFAVEGGFIVHNCIDACRYSLSEDMIERKVRSMSKKALGL